MQCNPAQLNNTTLRAQSDKGENNNCLNAQRFSLCSARELPQEALPSRAPRFRVRICSRPPALLDPADASQRSRQSSMIVSRNAPIRTRTRARKIPMAAQPATEGGPATSAVTHQTFQVPRCENSDTAHALSRRRAGYKIEEPTLGDL